MELPIGRRSKISIPLHLRRPKLLGHSSPRPRSQATSPSRIPNSVQNIPPAARWASSSAAPPKTALFFPGQGVQRVGMADPWLSAFPRTCNQFLEETDSILQRPLSALIASGPNSTLTTTENAQPAIMATSVMILRVLEEDFSFATKDRISVCLGHSLGEFAALVTGGYLSYPNALRLIARRASVMARCSRDASDASSSSSSSSDSTSSHLPHSPPSFITNVGLNARSSARTSEYGMVALVCEPARLQNLISTIQSFLSHGANEGSRADSAQQTAPIDQVCIANINSKNQIVLSGNVERISTLLVQMREFTGHDPRAVRLATDSPFHSPIMKPAYDLIRDSLSTSPSPSPSPSPISPHDNNNNNNDSPNDKIPITFPASIPVISNISARPFTSAASVRDLLARQCTETVRWWDSIRYLDTDFGVRRWIGLGPGKVGRNLVGKEVGMKGPDVVRGGGVWGVTEPREVEVMLRGLESTEGTEGVG